MPQGAEWVEWMRSQGVQVESHLRLFTDEAVRHMTDDEFGKLRLKYIEPKPFADRAKYLWPGVETTISEWLAHDWDNAAAIHGEQQQQLLVRRICKARLFTTICTVCRDHPESAVELLHIVTRCKKSDSQAYRELVCTDLSTFEFYRRMFDPTGNTRKMDAISTVLEPQIIFPALRKVNAHEYGPLIGRAEALYKHSKTHGAKTSEQREWELAHNELFCDLSACTLLRGLPFCTDVAAHNSGGSVRVHEPGDWYYHFMEACDTDPKTRPLLRYIDPNFVNDLARWRAHKEVEATRVPNWEQNLSLVNQNGDEPVEPRDPQKYAEHRNMLPETSYFVPDEYQLRPYQNELIVHANNKKNTIICAPTGSGKTIVATDIIRTHLETAKREGRVARCVMLVPTVPLVDQQCCEFVQYLAGHYWLDGFSGCENLHDGRAKRVLACDLCVMTPQILINMLNSVLETERVYFADFTLVIFDECHHCNKGHPYKMLMDQLAELDNSKNGKRPHIQIVGLTASLGVGDTSWDMAACQRHMLSLCANLRAETISTVRHQLENLKEYVTPPVDRVEKISRPVNNEFVEAIKLCMSEIQRSMQVELQRIVEQKQLSYIGKDDIVFPNLDDQAQYQNRVGLLKKYLQHLEEPVTRVFLLRSINHLSHYFHAIAISDLLPNSFAIDYLQKKMADSKPSDNEQFNRINAVLLKRYNELLQQLRDIERSESEEKEQKKRALLSTGGSKYLFNMERKEILNRLHRILYEQFEKNADSRALIFVATRACAQRLAKHLMELDSELPMFYQMKNVGYMVSSNQSGSMGGQSSDEQRLMREGFSKGTIKVLVVTSVAEEGVNIAACNLIIKYNNVGSERQMIQRRGRARHKNSKSILLALDTGVEQQEFSNMRKEAMMMRCIEDMQEQEEQTLRKKIEEKTKEMDVIRNEEKKKTESKREQLMGRRFILKCTCGTLICYSDRVRSVMGTLFVCCDPEVWKRSKHALTRSPTKEQFYTNCARWLCTNCGEHWGQIVKYSNVFLPEIRVRAFVMERVDQQRGELDRSERVGKKWKDIEQSNFNIDAVSMADIRSMYKSLLETNPEAHKEYEKQSRQADQLVADKMAEKELRGRERKERLFLEE